MSETEAASDNPWEDLVISLLSVNQYSLEQTYRVIDTLRDQGLFNPSNLMNWNQLEIGQRMKLAGCDRGPFMTNLFAFRIVNLGDLIRSKGLADCTKIISFGNAGAVEELLLPVNGIGPKVIANFRLLRELPNK